MNTNSDLIHIKVTFEDTFSFAKTEKTCTRSRDTFEKMKANIGTVVHQFSHDIHWQWKVIKVEQI